ncbi:MAG: B12-binding domain-containing radical SAM protein [PVC group bacterium]|nr:B12-binding domain-containing radical SAM protein [PVC group bacterium]
MRVAFVYHEMEALGIEHLSGYLKENGHIAKLIFDPQLFEDSVYIKSSFNQKVSFRKELFKQVYEFKPDLLAFSVLSTNYAWAKRFAGQLKEEFNIPIVFGGIHPTLAPEEVIKNDFVDYIIRGEGEEALLDLVENLHVSDKLSSIPNLGLKLDGKVVLNDLRPVRMNLDEFPFPDKDLFYDEAPYLMDHYAVITSRGCPYACTFCCNDSLRKIHAAGSKYVRRRSPDNVIRELERAKHQYKIKDVIFDDSTFTYDRKWLKEFSSLYKEKINLNCFAWVHPTEIDEEIVEYLKTMRCRSVEMGVESLNPQIREKWLHRYYSNDQVRDALKLLKKNNISCTVDNIVGLPEEKKSDLEYMVEFYNETRPEKIYIFEYRGFPNTKLTSLLQKDHKDSCHPNKDMVPFTLFMSGSKLIKKITILVLLIHIFPKSVIRVLLKHRIYRFFPSVNAYNLLEIIPFFVTIFKNIFRKNKLWFVLRGTRYRYLYYIKKKIFKKR